MGAGGALDPGSIPQERVGPQEPELDLGVSMCVGGRPREADCTPMCGRTYTRGCLTKEGPVRTDREFPVPGDPGTGRSWRWGFWLPRPPQGTRVRLRSWNESK